MKTCTKCGLVKQLLEFSVNRRALDGRKFTCKTCDRASSEKYRNHPITVANKMCQTCATIKDADQFAIDRGNSTGLRGDCRKCYASKKAARMRTPEGRAQIFRRNRSSGKYSASKSLAIKRGYVWELSRDDYYNIIRCNACIYDGEALPPTGSGLDRKDNNVGYVLDNVVPCCTRCNTIKSDYWSYEEMLEIGSLMKSLRHKRGG